MPPLSTLKSTLQREDESLSKIIEGVNQKDEKYRDFAIFIKLLYHIASPVRYDPELRLQMFIPKEFRTGVLTELHDSFSHMAMDKTHHLLRSRHYWPGMYKDVTEYLNLVDICREREIREQRAPMQEAFIPKYPFQCIGMDTTGPLPESEYDNAHIIVIGNQFSGWPEAFAVSNKDVETVL